MDERITISFKIIRTTWIRTHRTVRISFNAFSVK